jgi:hypothetical protein
VTFTFKAEINGKESDATRIMYDAEVKASYYKGYRLLEKSIVMEYGDDE